MPAFTITVPDAASLPTSMTKILNAMVGLVVGLHPYDDAYPSTDVQILDATEDELGTVTLRARLWDVQTGNPGRATHSFDLDLIGSITVH